jgi:NDP-sugar pyrophosphorylase family protein
MKAMILAAGLGTRLRPLTDDRPKALVEINGRTLLEITLSRLRQFGISEVIINAHHFADALVAYLRAKSNFGMQIEISREDVLLDTGGGLKKAANFFLRDSGSNDQPFILHNVDVLSDINLHQMLRLHQEHRALATLAVKERKSSRYLLFDQNHQLCGRRTIKKDSSEPTTELVRAGAKAEPLAFCGIHIISPRLLTLMQEQGVFSIIDTYLRLAVSGENILAFRADQFYWRDLGRPEQIAQAASDFASGLLSLPPLPSK